MSTSKKKESFRYSDIPRVSCPYLLTEKEIRIQKIKIAVAWVISLVIFWIILTLAAGLAKGMTSFIIIFSVELYGFTIPLILLYHMWCKATGMLEMHAVAQREASGEYPMLAISGARLKDDYGVYYVKGCRVNLAFKTGVVKEIAEEKPDNVRRVAQRGAFRLVVEYDDGTIGDIYAKIGRITEGGMSEEEWSRIKDTVPKLTLGGKPI